MSAILNVLCCAGNCCCAAVSNICSETMKINPKLFSRIGFILVSAVSIVFALLILFFGQKMLSPFNGFINCPDTNNLSCLGIINVYRMSFALACFHLLIMIFSLFGDRCAEVINTGCWTFKLLAIAGFYFGFFFIDNKVFIVYAQIARYFSIVFVLYQVLVTISFAHVINIKIVERLEQADANNQNNFCLKFTLIGLSVLFLALALFFNIYGFIYLSLSAVAIVFNVLSLIFGLLLTALSISNYVNRKRLLTSIVIFSFISYLTWSAMISKPSEYKLTIGIKISDILIGLGYTVFALSFLGFYIKKEKLNENLNPYNKPAESEGEAQKEIDKSPLLESEELKSDAIANNILDEEKNLESTVKVDFKISKAYYLFHAFMFSMSIYYTMLLTNWTVLDTDKTHSTDDILQIQSIASFWIKVGTMLATVLLYVWVLIAPKLFPDREFDF